MIDETYWFLLPQEKISELREKLPPVPTPEADALLSAIKLAREDREKQFLQSLIDYLKVGIDYETAFKTAKEDWLED